jgi:septal ring factor EnvC (AmiA/AmiB activator)
MRLPFRTTRLSFGHALAALMLAAMVAAPLAARAAQRPAQTTQQQETKQKLAALHAQMEALAKQQAETANRRDRANAELAKQANAVAAAARAVHDTDAAIADGQQQLAQLQQQRGELQNRLDGQRAAIADLLRATYTLGRGSDLQLLLGDQDLARIARALVYSKYFQNDRLQRVQQLMGDLAKLQQLEASISTEQQTLEATRTERAQQAQTLAAQRSAQQKLVAQTDAQYKDQAARLAALKQNEQALDQLLDKLQKAIDAAAREAERAAQAEREAARRAHHGTSRPPPVAPPGKALANIRGDLPWPAGGAVVSYGSGVLIKAAGGSEVHAVARGRVVYAAFLRGYGMLIIVNHGDGWMSMYGNNETLLHGVGDLVDAGQAVGTATAPTGTNTGVYFELRQHGKPVDPRSWLSQRR